MQYSDPLLNWILQVINETLSSAADMVSAEAFMHFLAWLAAQFVHTVKHPSRASSSQQQPSQQAAAATCASVPLSADFFFFATLLQPLLSHMQAETPSASLLHSSMTSAITSTAVNEGSIPATATTQAAAAAASQPKKRKGQKAGKGRMQAVQETHGRPVEWAVAAEGAASLVQPTHLDTAHDMSLSDLLMTGQFHEAFQEHWHSCAPIGWRSIDTHGTSCIVLVLLHGV